MREITRDRKQDTQGQAYYPGIIITRNEWIVLQDCLWLAYENIKNSPNFDQHYKMEIQEAFASS